MKDRKTARISEMLSHTGIIYQMESLCLGDLMWNFLTDANFPWQMTRGWGNTSKLEQFIDVCVPVLFLWTNTRTRSLCGWQWNVAISHKKRDAKKTAVRKQQHTNRGFSRGKNRFNVFVWSLRNTQCVSKAVSTLNGTLTRSLSSTNMLNVGLGI